MVLGLDMWFAITLIGDIRLWMAFIFLLGIWEHKFEKNGKRRIFEKRLLALTFSCIILIAVIVTAIKILIAEPRTCIPCTAAVSEPCNPYCPSDDPYTFPSGHASVAFAGFTAAFMAIPRKSAIHLLLFIFPALVAASRLVFGIHIMADVIAGSLIGIIVAFSVSRYAAGKIK